MNITNSDAVKGTTLPTSKQSSLGAVRGQITPTDDAVKAIAQPVVEAVRQQVAKRGLELRPMDNLEETIKKGGEQELHLMEQFSNMQKKSLEKSAEVGKNWSLQEKNEQRIAECVTKTQISLRKNFPFLAKKIAKITEGKEGKELILERVKQIALFVLYAIGTIFTGIYELMNYLIRTSKDEVDKELSKSSYHQDLKKKVHELKEQYPKLREEELDLGRKLVALQKELDELRDTLDSYIEERFIFEDI